MFCCINRKPNQKELYFDIDRVFRLNNDKKISGIYVLFKNDICLYVGQSKNLSSRLATHLCGRYESVDKVLIYQDFDSECEDNDDILNYSEKFAIKYFKPIENILADFTEEIDINCTISQFYDFNNGVPLFYTYEIIISDNNIFISDDEIILNFSENKKMKKEILYCINTGENI